MPENSSKNPDSIPSISFTALLSVFFKAIAEGIKDFIRFIFRHKIVMIISILAGIIIGIINYKTTRVYYKISMIVRHTELNLKTYGQMLKSLNTLAESGSYDALAKSLAIDPETARKIRSFSGISLAGGDLSKDTSTARENTFLIQMTIHDLAIADTMEKIVVNYFNNNPYLNKLKQDEILLYTERLQFVNNELRRMDSLKDAYNRSLASSKTALTYYNNALNPADLYDESNIYAETRTMLGEWLLQKRQPIVAIDGVKSSIAPYSIDLDQSMITYAVIFFFLGCILSGILEIAWQNKQR